MVDVLGPLSARPPTPPRTASRMLSEKDRTEDSPVTVQTPTESHFLPNGSTGAPSSRQSKRVNFSPWPNFIKAPSFTDAKPSEIKALLPSNDRKPTRSILKATNSPGPVSPAGVIPNTPESFAMLLESITQLLAGESTSSRIDAYMQFFGALRAYEKVPTEDEIVRKLGLITQFIQRDISRDLKKGGTLDTNLVINALKLSVVLVWHPQISPQLPEDFKLFLLEHSVNCLEDGKLPKSVATHYLTLLSTQKFSTKIITTARAIRILEMLHGLTDRVKGNSVVSQRLTIYERLFELSKSTFISHSALWMDHLISGLLHQIKNVRLNALELGFNAYMASGANSTLSKTLRDIFDRPLANDRKLVSEISERMSRMMASPETGEHVPQIWGVITLLLRNKRFNIDQWQHFKEWVLVLQKCFNCSDPEIKSKAIGNWNRFVLVVNISESTTPSLLRMLSKPILSQFERKKHDKQNPQPSQLVVASYYNLLYYAFRPDASHQQLDIVWGEYIASPSSNIFASVPSLSDRLAHALSNMLWSSHPIKAWSDNRVNEPKRIVAEELPPLDCKWVRSRVPFVLKVFEDILKSSVWDPELEKSNIATAWVSLSHALAFAASKEITPSQESMQTVAHVLGLLERLWHAGPSSLNAAGENATDTFFERFRFLSTTMILILGSIPFTEKMLLKTTDSTYQASNTPTHHNSKASNHLDSPILHLLRLISDASQIPAHTAAYSLLIKDTVEASCHGKVSRGSRLDILRQCANVYSDDSDDSEIIFGSGGFAQIVWTSAAHLSADCLCSFPIESARERDGSITRDYTTVFMILCQGLRFADKSSAWDRLLDAFVRVMRTERGDLSIATMVLEPLAGKMMGLDVRSAYSPASSVINHSLSIHFDYDSGVKSGNSNTNSPPHPHALIGLLYRVLSESYEFSDPQNLDGVAIFIESLVSFLGSGTFTFRSVLLDRLQSPLGLYLKDARRKYTVENGVDSRILTACRAISTAILNILQILPHDSWNLQKYEHIICSGLMSSHISTAKRFADFWRSSFGIQQFLQCPPIVSQALGDLEARVDSQKAGVLHRSSTLASQASHLEIGHGQHNNRLVAESSNIRSEDGPVKSKIDFILDAPTGSSYSARVESSPVIAGSQSAASTLQKTESSLDQVAPEGPADNATRLDEPAPSPAKEDTTRHREVFSMIDSLRSSSPPATTPKELGFMTPPHLRSLRNVESETETPKTPTIAAVAAENEDGFLGSSPTPAIRGRTSSVASAIPPSFSEPGKSMDIDPPSSPPEPERQSTDSGRNTPQPSNKGKDSKNNKRRNRSRRSKTPSKEKSPNQERPDNAPTPNEQAGQNQEGLSQKSLRSRLHSTAEKSPAKKESTERQQADPTEKTQQTQEKPKTPKTLCNEPGYNPVAAPDPLPELTPVPHHENPDAAVESASEDTDTQAMSQLEHDLVFAVDLGSDAADKEAAESTQTAAITRKRKREGENWAAMAKKERERRRSSRISSTSTPTAEVEDSQTMRSKKPKLSTVSRETPTSPANSAAKKRKHDAVDSASVTPKRDRSKKNKDTAQETEMQESQKRRSGRISGVPGPTFPPAEEDPGPKKSPRPNSSRKQDRKQKNRRSERRQSQPAEETSNQEATTAGESAHEKADEQQQPQPPLADNISEQHLESHNSLQVNEPEPHPNQEKPPKQSEDVEMTEVPKSAQPEAQAEATTDEPQHETGIEHHVPSEPIQAQQSPVLPEPEPQPEPEPEQKEELEPAPQPNQDTQISSSLRSLIDQVKLASLDRNTVKKIDDLLFDLRVEMHEALRRHRDTTATTSIQ